VWIGKHFYGIDIREHGSHNAGTTNMLRVLGRRAAIPVFVIDFLKGFVAVTLSNLVFYHAGTSLNDLYLVKILLVVAAVLGHIFPLFAGFKGGKGVATMAGAVMGVDPAGVMVCLAVWVIMLMVTHYVSLSSMIAGATFPIVMMVSPKTNGSLAMIIFSFVVAIMLIVTHRKNIKRLMEGTESKIYIWKPAVKPTPPQKEDETQGHE
jgi:glycerol-3-phosphate acyltransferase PlsY